MCMSITLYRNEDACPIHQEVIVFNFNIDDSKV